ncbi:MAG: hypothetical protein ACE5F6_12510 [Anaerolineae bacterium]
MASIRHYHPVHVVRVVQCDSTLLFVSAQGASQRQTMQLLSHILGGHDRSSLLIGLVLGGFFIFVVMNAYEWFQNTRDLVIGRTATARKKVKQKKDEIQEIEQEARDLRRIGCSTGFGRVVFFTVLALGAAWCIIRAWQTGIP